MLDLYGWALLTYSWCLFHTALNFFLQFVYYPNLESLAYDHKAITIYQKTHFSNAAKFAWVIFIGEFILTTYYTHLSMIKANYILWNRIAEVAYVALIIIWLTTFFVLIPIHKRLELGWSKTQHTQLLRTQAIRTICSTVRCVIYFYELRNLR